MPSTTFAETTTSTTSGVLTMQTTKQATSPTMKEQGVTSILAEATEVMTATVSTTTQADIDWKKVNELDQWFLTWALPPPMGRC